MYLLLGVSYSNEDYYDAPEVAVIELDPDTLEFLSRMDVHCSTIDKLGLDCFGKFASEPKYLSLRGLDGLGLGDNYGYDCNFIDVIDQALPDFKEGDLVVMESNMLFGYGDGMLQWESVIDGTTITATTASFTYGWLIRAIAAIEKK